MGKDELALRIFCLCREYGLTTDHTEELIQKLVDSMVMEEDEGLAA